MWIKPEFVPENKNFIIIAPDLAKELKSRCKVIFGEKTARVKVRTTDELAFYENSKFDSPMTIKLSCELREKLLMPETLVYRAEIENNKIIIGPIIGFMLGNDNYIYSPKHMNKYSDRFGIYDAVGGLIYAFSPQAIDWKKRIVYGLYYNITRNKWEYGKFPLPSVIYRRDFHQSTKIVERLSWVTKGRLFNSYRFTKLKLYEFVLQDPELAAALPPTESLTSYNQLKSFVDKHLNVILKPVDLSRGRGICIIKKIDQDYRVIDYRYKHASELLLKGSEKFENFFETNKDFYEKYLIQKFLPLATIKDSPFDIRVVMQKKDKENWNCTGIECRVSGHGSHITNISRGGYAMELHEALKHAFQDEFIIEQLTKKILEYCLKFCTHMDKMNQHFAEFGIDIAIDKDKNLWLIEANVFPSFKGFKIMNYDTYLAIRYTPLLYALSLTEFKDENNVD